MWGERLMSRKFKALLVALAVVIQLGAVAAIGAGSASAAIGPVDDRQMAAPTSWWTYSGVTATQVSSLLSANKARLTDIGVDDAAIPSFTVAPSFRSISSSASSSTGRRSIPRTRPTRSTPPGGTSI
jgi:hypothetical protein